MAVVEFQFLGDSCRVTVLGDSCGAILGSTAPGAGTGNPKPVSLPEAAGGCQSPEAGQPAETAGLGGWQGGTSPPGHKRRIEAS